MIDASKFDKTYFSSKGASAETFVHKLTEKSMFTDRCYRNPMLKPGVELCDMLVVFDDTVIIMQIKDLKLRKDGSPNFRDQGTNIKQLHGAYRQLMELKSPIKLINPRRGPTAFRSAFQVNDRRPVRSGWCVSGIVLICVTVAIFCRFALFSIEAR